MKLLLFISLICHSLCACRLGQPVTYTTLSLDLDMKSMYKQMAKAPQDSAFQHWFHMAESLTQEPSIQPFVDRLVATYREGEMGFSAGEMFASLAKDLPPSTPAEDMFKWLKEEDAAAKSHVQKILLDRLDEAGISKNKVRMMPSGDRLEVGIEGDQDKKRLAYLLTTTGAMEFWETYTVVETFHYLDKINTFLRAGQGSQDSTMLPGEDEITHFERLNPLFKVLSPPPTNISHTSPLVGFALAADLPRVDEMIQQQSSVQVLPTDMALKWGKSPLEGPEDEVYELIALRKIPSHFSPVTEKNIKGIRADFDQQLQPVISLELTQKGTKTFENMTEASVGKSIAIVIDGRVYSYPTVQEPIRTGEIMISGNLTVDETRDLSAILSTGRLPVPVTLRHP